MIPFARGWGYGERVPLRNVHWPLGVMAIVAVAQGGNVGTGTIADLTVRNETLDGVYTLTFTAPTQFVVRDPDDLPLGLGIVGEPWSFGGISGRVVAGVTAFAVNDAFDLTVTEVEDNGVYDFAAVGNLGLVNVYEAGVPIRDRALFAALARTYQQDGEYLTAARISTAVDAVTPPITADLLRIYPDVDGSVVYDCKFLGDLRCDVTGHALVAHPAGGTLPTFVLGPTGVGLAARFDGTPCLFGAFHPGLNAQSFCLEALAQIDGDDANPNLARALVANANATTAAAWEAAVIPATRALRLRTCQADGSTKTLTTADGVWTPHRPTRFGFERDETTAMRIWVDGDVVAEVTTGLTPIPYVVGQVHPAIVGYNGDHLKATLAYLRVSNRVRTARYHRRAHWLFRRNPVEAAREVVERELRATPDDASFETAATAVANVPSVGAHRLTCDGYQSDPIRYDAWLAALGRFRAFAFGRTAAGKVTVVVPTQPTTAVAAFSVGPPWNNIAGAPRRIKRSSAEAIRSVPLRYRVARDANGVLAGYQITVHAKVGGAGRVADPLDFPFVYTRECADLLRDWVAKLTRADDEALELPVAHEARTLRPWDIVQVTAPEVSISTPTDYRVATVSLAGPQVDVVAVPYDPALWTYAPEALPPEPTLLSLALDVGNAPDFTINPATWTVDVVLESIVRDPPIAAGFIDWETVVGANAVDAVDDPVGSPDGATSYIETAWPLRYALFLFPAFRLPRGRSIASVGVGVIAKQAAGTGNLPAALYAPTVSATRFGIGGVTLTASFPGAAVERVVTDVPWTRPLPNVMGRAWQPEDLLDLQLGVGGSQLSSAASTVTQIYRIIRTRLPSHARALGFVKVWVVGPSATQPATPVDGVDVAAGDDNVLTGIAVPPPSGTTGDKFWFWVGIYDLRGRRAALLGPKSVTL